MTGDGRKRCLRCERECKPVREGDGNVYWHAIRPKSRHNPAWCEADSKGDRGHVVE